MSEQETLRLADTLPVVQLEKVSDEKSTLLLDTVVDNGGSDCGNVENNENVSLVLIQKFFEKIILLKSTDHFQNIECKNFCK